MKTGRQEFRHTVIVRALIAATCGSASMMLAHEALAQQSGQSLQRVEITGSNIRRTEAETASPVQTVTREDLEKSGKVSVAEYLQTLAVDNQGSVPTTFGSGFASGASGLSLRGLGASSTLVLINGRRIAPYGMADDGQKVFADLNVIPLEAVQRVEILKDGASAIYGSDAIGGVVNIILRKNFKGTVAKASLGQSRYSDGTDRRAAITHGFGDMDTQGFNVLLNLEVGKKDAIYNRDRAGRGAVGRTDLRPEGFDAESSGGANGGTGAIIADRGAAVSSVVGNVRNPATNEYFSRHDTSAGNGFTRTFPGACATMAGGYPQGDPGGGCLTDATQQYGMVQPKDETINFFGRLAKQINANTEAYAELNVYNSNYVSQTTPSGVHGSVGYPGGPVNNVGVSLGAAHPDNPYFGQAARVRYIASDVGPRTSDVNSTFTRLVAGVKGVSGVWDYDTAFLFSQTKTDNDRTGYLQRDATFALLNPSAANVAAAMAGSPAYAALPAGSYWRIGENAGANSPAIYAAISPTISNSAQARTAQIDFKASRELGKLAGGPIGVAIGAELRRESITLDPTSGTERGNIIGLGYSAYDGARNIFALYGEGLFPVTKQLELSAALRADRYSDVGTSVTPKLGAKWTPLRNFALRGTYAEGFRAPNSAENGRGGLAFYTSAADPARCNPPTIVIGCSAGQVAGITSPNPNLEPEESKNVSLGMVWDVTPKTNLTFDVWQIKRRNEINQGSSSAAIAAGNVVRDPSTAIPGVAGDPGGIVAILINYENSAQTTVQGADLDAKHRIDFGASRLTLSANWTHLFKWLREEKDGTRYDYAGTHGNCDVTNCIGTPKDRINFGATWETGRWRVAAMANYRGSMSNRLHKDDPDCATHYADGSDAPSGCKISSFVTVDLGARWKFTDKTEFFGSIQNLFDKKPPLDPTTYGAASYNPLDYRGAVGRFYSVGVRHQF